MPRAMDDIFTDFILSTKTVTDNDEHTTACLTNRRTCKGTRHFVKINRDVPEEKRNCLRNPHAEQEVVHSAQNFKELDIRLVKRGDRRGHHRRTKCTQKREKST